MVNITGEELAEAIRVLRARREFLRHLMEMQKSQRRRGLKSAVAELSRLKSEYDTLDSLIRKLWTRE